MWCGGDEAVEEFRNEPRCGTCREHEAVIDEARKFMGMYGLRPIGGTLQSDDEEEQDGAHDKVPPRLPIGVAGQPSGVTELTSIGWFSSRSIWRSAVAAP